MATVRPVRLYESSIPSGNAHKVRLLLGHLGVEVQRVQLDILADPPETRQPAFLAKNPNGRIPLLELDDGTYLAESGAILWFLAHGTPYAPDDAVGQGKALQWMFFEQYSHEPHVAVLKFWTYWGGLHRKSSRQIARLKKGGQAALGVMEEHLEHHPWFTGERYGIADIALFAYTRSAGDVGFDMQAVPSVVDWLHRIPQQPGYTHFDPR
ncbi:MAG: glutathione S-transferase family protein [Myxococcales bacterium]|nr:glutathione S-transferase family protein [Myxococcales bacterium]